MGEKPTQRIAELNLRMEKDGFPMHNKGWSYSPRAQLYLVGDPGISECHGRGRGLCKADRQVSGRESTPAYRGAGPWSHLQGSL